MPDLIGIVQYGVVYTGEQGKIAEHGGANPQDRDVPLVVSGPAVHQDRSVATAGRDHPDRPDDPEAARASTPAPCRRCRIEHTRVLPLR